MGELNEWIAVVGGVLTIVNLAIIRPVLAARKEVMAMRQEIQDLQQTRMTREQVESVVATSQQPMERALARVERQLDTITTLLLEGANGRGKS